MRAAEAKAASTAPTDSVRAGEVAGALRTALAPVAEQARPDGLFPFGITRINLALNLPGGFSATLGVEAPGRFPSMGALTAASKSKSIDDLDLAPNARAGAQSLSDRFPGDIVFTSGRRTVDDQCRAMAHNIVKTGDRRWIAKTYRSGQALQDWVDAHPQATTADDLQAGLASVMTGWDDARLKTISYHLSGAAFDVAPVDGDVGDAIRTAIAGLANLNKFIDGEAGIAVWHLQFDE